MDATQALKDAENSLRDFISAVLSKKHGATWVDSCGVSPERVEKWKERRLAEENRQEGGVVEERLIYYADFYDIGVILKKNWQEFSEALGSWKTMEVWLGELEKLRDPDAHRRELLPHQKQLAMGISGEIRTRLIRYRNKLEAADDYFPKLESVRDSLGNIWTYDTGGSIVRTGNTLRVGDTIDYVITATDPRGEPLQYAVYIGFILVLPWQESNTLSLRIDPSHIGKNVPVKILMKSHREHTAYGQFDDGLMFQYDILPAKGMS